MASKCDDGHGPTLKSTKANACNETLKSNKANASNELHRGCVRYFHKTHDEGIKHAVNIVKHSQNKYLLKK